jgi:hypothetical protein
VQYAYCNGNPVNFTDPWGLQSLIVIPQDIQDKVWDFLGDAGDLAGEAGKKLWASPGTGAGLVLGGAGSALGAGGNALGLIDEQPRIYCAYNAIVFENNPLMLPGAGIALGNTINFGMGANPSDDISPYHGSPLKEAVNLGLHEEAHTYQWEALGPFFPFIYILSGGYWKPSYLEHQADYFAFSQEGGGGSR